MNQPQEQYNTVNLPLASLDEAFNLYQIKIDKLNIYNPYIDPTNEIDPPLYKGVRVDLGTKIIQTISRWKTFGDVSALAEAVKDGTFKPRQNWTYFWLTSAKNFITGVYWGNMRYLGTSPSSLTTDTWNITGLSYKYQRQF